MSAKTVNRRHPFAPGVIEGPYRRKSRTARHVAALLAAVRGVGPEFGLAALLGVLIGTAARLAWLIGGAL